MDRGKTAVSDDHEFIGIESLGQAPLKIWDNAVNVYFGTLLRFWSYARPHG